MDIYTQGNIVTIGRRMDMVEQVKEKMIMKRIGEWYYDKICKKPEVFERYLIGPDLDEFSHWNAKRTRIRWKYIMFTINFKPEISLIMADIKVKKAIKKKWIVRYMYCWEWRDRNEKGMHVHMKVELKDGKSPYECRREMYNTFKSLVGNKQHVNSRYSNEEGCFVQYIKGYRYKGDIRSSKNDWDGKIREDLGLRPYYGEEF